MPVCTVNYIPLISEKAPDKKGSILFYMYVAGFNYAYDCFTFIDVICPIYSKVNMKIGLYFAFEYFSHFPTRLS